MALLKENGSLDIERINNLPFEEHITEIAHFTKAQRKEYISKLPLNESRKSYPSIYGSIKDELSSGKIVDAFEVIGKL